MKIIYIKYIYYTFKKISNINMKLKKNHCLFYFCCFQINFNDKIFHPNLPKWKLNGNYISQKNGSHTFNKWMIYQSYEKKTRLNELLIWKTFNNTLKKIINNTTKWSTICLANKELKKHDKEKMMYNEICIVFFLVFFK